MSVPLRLSADWMTLCDERLLEFLDVEGPHTPKGISDDTRIHFVQRYVNRRLVELADRGLVERNAGGRGVYAITDRGRAYLAGELDAGDLDAEG